MHTILLQLCRLCSSICLAGLWSMHPDFQVQRQPLREIPPSRPLTRTTEKSPRCITSLVLFDDRRCVLSLSFRLSRSMSPTRPRSNRKRSFTSEQRMSSLPRPQHHLDLATDCMHASGTLPRRLTELPKDGVIFADEPHFIIATMTEDVRPARRLQHEAIEQWGSC